MKKNFHTRYERGLMSTLRAVADLCCEKLGVNYKSFNKIHANDPLIKEHWHGYNRDGHIRIFLYNRDLRYYSLASLVDTVVHEVAHLIYLRHDKRHKRCHNMLLRYVKKYLKERIIF